MRTLAVLLALFLLCCTTHSQQPPPTADDQIAPLLLSPTDQTRTIRATIPDGKIVDPKKGSQVQYGQAYILLREGKLAADLKLDRPEGGIIQLGNIAEKLAAIRQPLPLFFKLPENFKLTDKDNWVLPVEAIHFRPVGEWDRLYLERISDVKGLKGVKDATENLRESSSSLLTNLKPLKEDVEQFLTDVDDVKAAALSALLTVKDPEAKGLLNKYLEYLEADTKDFLSMKRNDPVVINALSSLSELQAGGAMIVNKDFYGRSDNYRPEILAMGVQRSTATVSIRYLASSEIKVGTGSLIGKNLVLTCWHCVSSGENPEKAENDYRVVLFDDHRSKDWIKEPKHNEITSTCIVLCKNVEIDYCLLKIIPAETDQPAVSEIKHIPLITGRAGFMTPVYVIGYPQGGNLAVHDNSWVIFPFKITDDERALLLSKLAQSTLPDYEPWSSENLITLSRRYERAQTTAEQQLARHYPPPATPTELSQHHFRGESYIGLESDTFKGDSGAPVISRHRGGIIGILRSGVSDTHIAAKNTTDHPRRITSDTHERAIPIKLILDDVKTQLGKDWGKDYGPTIEE